MQKAISIGNPPYVTLNALNSIMGHTVYAIFLRICEYCDTRNSVEIVSHSLAFGQKQE